MMLHFENGKTVQVYGYKATGTVIGYADDKTAIVRLDDGRTANIAEVDLIQL